MKGAAVETWAAVYCTVAEHALHLVLVYLIACGIFLNILFFVLYKEAH